MIDRRDPAEASGRLAHSRYCVTGSCGSSGSSQFQRFPAPDLRIRIRESSWSSGSSLFVMLVIVSFCQQSAGLSSMHYRILFCFIVFFTTTLLDFRAKNVVHKPATAARGRQRQAFLPSSMCDFFQVGILSKIFVLLVVLSHEC